MFYCQDVCRAGSGQASTQSLFASPVQLCVVTGQLTYVTSPAVCRHWTVNLQNIIFFSWFAKAKRFGKVEKGDGNFEPNERGTT